jgi:prevent-host-death family protein
MRSWQAQEAKAKFSEVIRTAEHSPQLVTMRGQPAVVIISQREYLRLTGPGVSFLELMQNSPLLEVEIGTERDCSEAREVEL